jgi:outer membrane protein assembly factor BamB
MLRIRRDGAAKAGAASSSLGVESHPAQAEQAPTKQVFKQLAIFQNTMLGLIIGLSCIVLLYIVLHYIYGGSVSRQTVIPNSSNAHSIDYTMPGNSSATDVSQVGKDVHVQLGASGDMIRWRFQVEDEDDSIKSLYMRGDGAAYIISKSEKLGGQRFDVVSAGGQIIGSSKVHLSHYLLAVGADGALYCHERAYEQEQVRVDCLGAFSLNGRRLWQAQLPHPFTYDIAVGGNGTVYAIGVTPQLKNEEFAHSCLCALKPSGKVIWTYEHEGGLYWPLPLEDGGALVWSRPRYSNCTHWRPGSISGFNTGKDKQRMQLLCLDRDGRRIWAYEAGYVGADYASVANGKVCAQLVEAGAAINEQLVLLDLHTGRELARYPSGPLSGKPLLRPDGAVVFSNKAGVMVALSPQLQVQWTNDRYGWQYYAPLVDKNNALYFTGGGGLVCLEADGSERFCIPTGTGVYGPNIMWGPDGMLYVGTAREVLAFQPQ